MLFFIVVIIKCCSLLALPVAIARPGLVCHGYLAATNLAFACKPVALRAVRLAAEGDRQQMRSRALSSHISRSEKPQIAAGTLC